MFFSLPPYPSNHPSKACIEFSGLLSFQEMSYLKSEINYVVSIILHGRFLTVAISQSEKATEYVVSFMHMSAGM